MKLVSYSRFNIFLLLALIVSITSCGNWIVPDTLVGNWTAPADTIVVRTREKGEGFQFYTNAASIDMQIKADKTVSGHIGSAVFDNGVLKRNPGNPERTGVAYIIACGTIGAIYPGDPLPEKEVELWILPVENQVEAELRFTSGGAVMPMGDFVFSKSDQ